MKKFGICIILVLFVAISGCQHLRKSSEELTIIKNEDIIFCTVDGIDLKLDIVRQDIGNNPQPALLFIHGDDWKRGSRKICSWQMEIAARRGYVAVSADYRLTAESGENNKAKYPFPAQLHDLKSAVRWLRSNAKNYNVDSDRIGAFGISVGGHLALLLGLTDASDGLEGTGGNMDKSSKVQAVVNVGSPTDLRELYENHLTSRPYLSLLLGGSLEDVPDAYKFASPVSYIDKNDPSVLTVQLVNEHATGIDRGWPPQQSITLDIKMKEKGASHTLIIPKEDTQILELDLSMDFPVWDFFDKHLKAGK